MNTTTVEKISFDSLGINQAILQILGQMNLHTPTPIQAKAIPSGIEGKDVVGIAQTGTGKTFSFGIPMLQRLPMLKARGLVIVPTRELAMQVDVSLRSIGSRLKLRTAVVIGGASMRNQVMSLRSNPHIIIATPGRLNDHLQERTVKLDNVKMVVLDEADRMLDMGFAPQIKKILENVPSDRQTMLFSATMPPEIMKIAQNYMRSPIRIEVSPQGTTAEKVTQEVFIIQQNSKVRLLEALLQEHTGTVLVFTRTKYGAQKLTKILRHIGCTAAEIHSNRSLGQRKEALDGFKTGRYRVLIATDIASRGIDVSNIALVVNYDLPENKEDYVHRIGRTARAGARGHAVSFAAPDQKNEVFAIEKLIKQRIKISPLPELPPDRNLKNVIGDDATHQRDERRGDRRPPRQFSRERSFRNGHDKKRRFGR